MVEVKLAGFNIDAEVVKKLEKGEEINPEWLTPEIISASYARISRDPRDINELREMARKNVPKAKKSNQVIVFQMGHASIAEHAYLNFDVTHLSRLAVEDLEQHRLASYTEKSQRYITLKGDFVVPKELTESEVIEFKDLIAKQNQFYFDVLPVLEDYQYEKNPDMVEKRSGTLDGWAKEDARYGLSMATEAQLGFSCNARELEHIIRKFKYHPLSEVRNLGQQLYNQAKEYVPSLISYADEEAFRKKHTGNKDIVLIDDYYREGKNDLKDATSKLLSNLDLSILDNDLERKISDVLKRKIPDVKLTSSNDVDQEVLTALVSAGSELNENKARLLVSRLNNQQKLDYFKEMLQNLSKHDNVPREFERGMFSYLLRESASCYAQHKRHRMETILVKPYDPELGITIPEAVKAIGKEDYLKEIADRSSELFYKIQKAHPDNPRLAEYCLTNAHKREISVDVNLRELYAFSRLREDAHAQWDIRNYAHGMCRLAKNFAPVTTALLAGKSEFAEVRKNLYEGNYEVKENDTKGIIKLR